MAPPAESGSRTGRSDPAPGAARRRGFTLIELLMVLVILGVVTAMTMPALVRSIRGNRLRAAARTVVMAGRYARSIAVLDQSEMTLRFDAESGTVTVDAAEDRPAAAGGAEGEAAASAGPALGQAWPGEAPDPAPGAPGAAPARTVVRTLDRVQIESVRRGEGEAAGAGGGVDIVYRSNGTCEDYTVILVDEDGARVEIEVDALGSAKTETLN